jgi:hypothetical protein
MLFRFYAQLLFLSGVALVIGLQRTFSFFFQARKIRGSIVFFLGIVLVVIGWAKIGIFLEGFGFVNLFGCVSAAASASFPRSSHSRERLQGFFPYCPVVPSTSANPWNSADLARGEAGACCYRIACMALE